MSPSILYFSFLLSSNHMSTLWSLSNIVTQLHLALQIGSVDLVQFLTKHVADTAIPVKDRWTPLHLASHHGRVDLARFLVKRDADVTTAAMTESTPRIGHGANSTAQDMALIKNSAEAPVQHNDWPTPPH